jgi:hypothetical protein
MRRHDAKTRRDMSGGLPMSIRSGSVRADVTGNARSMPETGTLAEDCEPAFGVRNGVSLNPKQHVPVVQEEWSRSKRKCPLNPKVARSSPARPTTEDFNHAKVPR